MPNADDPTLRLTPEMLKETPESQALEQKLREHAEVITKGPGGGSIALTGDAKAKAVATFETIRRGQLTHLSDPEAVTAQIRRDTGAGGEYQPVKHMSMEEARRRGLVAPVESFESDDHLPLDPDAIEWYRERGLPIPEPKARVRVIAPTPAIQAGWDADVAKLSPKVSGEELATITSGVKITAPLPERMPERIVELEG